MNVPTGYLNVGTSGRVDLQGGFLRSQGIYSFGVISGSGEIAIQSSGFLQNSGRMEVGADEHLLFTAASFTELQNRGEITAHGGEIEISPRLTNDMYSATPGRITLQHGALRVGVIGSNEGQLQLVNRGLIAAIDDENHIYGSVSNESNGDIAVTNNSLLMFHNNVQTQQGSTMSVLSGSTAIFLQDLVMNGGTLLADLAGIGGYGHVEVVGHAQLGGALTINLSNGYAPSAGDSFELMKASGGIGGSLSVAPNIDLPNGLEWNLGVEANRLMLSVVARLAGDYNRDGSVDAADYTLWRDTLGSDSELVADGDGDNMVDEDDYRVWKSNFGATRASDGGAASLAVPEPASCMILALAMTSLLWPQRSHGRALPSDKTGRLIH